MFHLHHRSVPERLLSRYKNRSHLLKRAYGKCLDRWPASYRCQLVKCLPSIHRHREEVWYIFKFFAPQFTRTDLSSCWVAAVRRRGRTAASYNGSRWTSPLLPSTTSNSYISRGETLGVQLLHKAWPHRLGVYIDILYVCVHTYIYICK
jgi:hypothetical protein